jgi:hypothetical protein
VALGFADLGAIGGGERVGGSTTVSRLTNADVGVRVSSRLDLNHALAAGCRSSMPMPRRSIPAISRQSAGNPPGQRRVPDRKPGADGWGTTGKARSSADNTPTIRRDGRGAG